MKFKGKGGRNHSPIHPILLPMIYSIAGWLGTFKVVENPVIRKVGSMDPCFYDNIVFRMQYLLIDKRVRGSEGTEVVKHEVDKQLRRPGTIRRGRCR